MTQCGPEGRARRELDSRSMRMIRSWNRCVCTTHPRFTRHAVAESTPDRPPAASRSRTTRRARSAPRAHAGTGSGTACPTAARANHGAATISTNVSTTSLRHTKALHNGCSTARIRPTSSHFAATVSSAGGRTGREQHDAAGSGGDRVARRTRPVASRAHEHARRRSPRCSTVGTSRHSSTARPGDPKRPGSVRTCAPVGSIRRTAQPHRRAAQPGRALLRLGRRRGQHRDQSVLRHRAAGPGHPGVAEEGALADPRPARCAAIRRAVRRRRPSCRRRGTRRRRSWSSSAAAAPSTPRPRGRPRAPSSRSQRRGEQARVEREQQRPRRVHQPLDRPDLPADPAAHRVQARAQPDAEQPDRRRRTATGERRRTRSARPAAPQLSAAPVSARQRPRSHRDEDARTASAGTAATQRQPDEERSDVAP